MTTTATYVSDNRIDVAFTVAGTWDAYRILRETPTSAPAQVFQGMSAGSWSDTTVSASNRYRYSSQGFNLLGGSSALTYSGWVSTSPAAPSAVTAAKNALGDIVVTWQNNASAAVSFEVQNETTTIGTPAASPFTHTSPAPASTHRYRVRAVADGPRYSAWSAYSNTVATLGPPAAPDSLSPNGSAFPLDAALVLSWRHNPVDTTPQSAYELRHRPAGGSWTTLTGSTASTRTVTGYATTQTVEWQVRTKGGHADWSPWSTVASVPLVARPTATISTPTSGATITTSSVTVEWSYYHAGGGAQTAWAAEILNGSEQVEAASGSGTTSSWTTGTLPNGTTLTARVRVREPSGLWSQWASVSFSVNYAPPNPSTATAAWVNGFGHVAITATAVSGGGKPATVSHDFARSTDGGNTWVTFATGMPLDTTVLDWEAPASGTYHYRVTAVSALPSAAHSAAVEVTVPAVAANCVIWLGGGPGYAQVVKLAANPVISYDGGRERALHAFAGRSVPVEFSSMRASKTVSVSATLMGDADPGSSTRADLEDLFDLPGPHCYRDPFGRVLYGTLSGLSWSREPGVGIAGVSFSITRSAPPDAAQAAALAGFYAPRIAEVAPGVYRFINADAGEASPGVYVEVE